MAPRTLNSKSSTGSFLLNEITVVFASDQSTHRHNMNYNTDHTAY